MRYRSIHIILAILVYFSSTGVLIGHHWCQGQLKSASLFGQPASCHEQADLSGHPPGCPMLAKMGCEEEKDCCDNQVEFENSDTEQSFPLAELTVFPVFAMVPKLSFSLVAPTQQRLAFYDYHPPPLIRDHRVLFQIFLC